MPPVALDEHRQIALPEALAKEGVDVVHVSRWPGHELRTTSESLANKVTFAQRLR